MDKIHEIAADGAQMPRFDDGMVNMAELIWVIAESLVNEIMGAQADEACEAGNRRNGYRERRLITSFGTINLRIPKLHAGGATSPRTRSGATRAWTARSSPRSPRW